MLTFNGSESFSRIRFVKMPMNAQPKRFARISLHNYVLLLANGTVATAYDNLHRSVQPPNRRWVPLVEVLARWGLIPKAEAKAYADQMAQIDADRSRRGDVADLNAICQRLGVKPPKIKLKKRPTTYSESST